MNNEKIKELMKTKWHYHFIEDQEEQILLGLEENIDVSIYANSKFSASQMREIREGLKNNLDVSIYAKKSFTAERMLNERLKLKKSEIIVPFEKRNYLISDLKKGLK